MAYYLEEVDYNPWDIGSGVNLPEGVQLEPVDYDPWEEPKEKKPVEALDIPRKFASGAGKALSALGTLGAIRDPQFLMGAAAEAVGELTDQKNLTAAGQMLRKGAGPQQAIEMGQEAERYWEERVSPGMKEREAIPFLEGGWKDPYKVAGAVAESAPISIFGMGGGALITKGILTTTGNTLTPFVAGMIGGAIGEGTTAGAANAEEIYQTILNAPTKELTKMPAYKKIYNSLPEDLGKETRDRLTRKTLAVAGAGFVGSVTAITTGILGAPSGGLIGQILGGKASKSLWTNLIKGALAEGLIEEAPQSGVETFVSNITEKALIDAEKELGENVLEAMAGGAITGAVMGGGITAAVGKAEGVEQGIPEDAPIDLMEPISDTQFGQVAEQIKSDFSKGDLTVADLQTMKAEFPKGNPVVKTIDELIARDEALREPVIDLIESASQRDVDRETGLARPETGIPMPGAYPPLAGIPAEESAQAMDTGLAEEERVRRGPAGQEGLAEQMGEREAETGLTGLGGLSAFVTDLRNQVKQGKPGERIQIKDPTGPGEMWVGQPSSYPEFMRNKYTKDNVLKAIDKGLSGKPFKANEVEQQQIWEDVLAQAEVYKERDMVNFARLVEEEGPEGIEELTDTDYRSLLEALDEQGYSTRIIEDAAAPYRAPIHTRAIGSIAEQLGLTEDEAETLLTDEQYPIAVDDVWAEATSGDITEFEKLQEDIDRDQEEREQLVRVQREAEQAGEEEEVRGAVPEPEPGAAPAEPGGILQEPEEIAELPQPVVDILKENDQGPDDIIDVITPDQRKEYQSRYGIPNSVNLTPDDPIGLFGGRSGSLFIDDDTGKIVAYLPPHDIKPGGKLPKGGGPKKPKVSFYAWQLDADDQPVGPLFNVEGVGTVGEEKVRELGLEVPEVPAPEEAKPPEPMLPEGPTLEEEITRAAEEAEPEPTEAQIEAGNYKKGHVNVQGLDISIENPRGSVRRGIDRQGREWSTTLKHHYGYIRRTTGKDGDQVDAFLGSAPESENVYIIDQTTPETGQFDEHKAMIGFETEQKARAAYLANYEKGWKGLGAITEMNMEAFKNWLAKGDNTKPASGFHLGKERRKDFAQRKKVEEMTQEEMKKELLVDSLTRIPNRRAYDEAEKKAYQAVIDIDSLKWVNDNMGHESGDHMIVVVAAALEQTGAEVYRTGGDEFVAQADDEADLGNLLEDAYFMLEDAEITAEKPDGSRITKTGLEYSYGIGETYKEADEVLASEKEEREEAGLRAPRGEQPPGVVEVPAERKPDRERKTPELKDITIRLKAVRDVTGEEIEYDENAQAALDRADANITKLNSLLECVRK